MNREEGLTDHLGIPSWDGAPRNVEKRPQPRNPFDIPELEG